MVSNQSISVPEAANLSNNTLKKGRKNNVSGPKGKVKPKRKKTKRGKKKKTKNRSGY